MIKQRLSDIINDSSTPAGKAFDIVIQSLIVLSLIGFSIETLPTLSRPVRSALQVFELVTVIVFSFEYTVRVWVTPRRLRYMMSFYGLVDLLSILPFFLTQGLDLRAIRILRVFRLLQLLKLVRYTRAVNRFRLALISAKEELVLFLASTILLLFLSATGIYYFEHREQPAQFGSVFHCLWWAITTFTTVGYGDIFPVTIGGKVFTFFMLVLGLGIVAVPPGIIASALTRVREAEAEAEAKSPTHSRLNGDSPSQRVD